MKDAAKMAENIANSIESSSSFLKTNWKGLVIVFWMLLVTITLVRMNEAMNRSSSHNQVANLRMSVDDVRYSVTEMETEVAQMQRAVDKMESVVIELQSSVNRIHTEVKNNR